MNCIHNSSGGSPAGAAEPERGSVRPQPAFWWAPCRLVRQEGVLEEVGTDYLVLRQGSARTGCDLYALKFIELTDNAGT